MDAALVNLWSAIERANHPPPADLISAMVGLPDARNLPSPWATWILIGLVRHRERQLWVEQVVRTRLGGDPGRLAECGALGHPKAIPPKGLVPGITEWEYYFHGRGCCLTHRVTGERIDVDFYGDTAEYFDDWFYIWYLQSLKEPEPPEQRIIALHPSFRTILLAIAELRSGGVLDVLPQSKIFKLCDAALEHADEMEAFCETWARADRRLWAAVSIGDWLAAHAAAAATRDSRLTEVLHRQAEACRARREQSLGQHFRNGELRPEALTALADLDARGLDYYLRMVLDGQPSGTTSAALEIISQRNDPRWCRPLYRLLKRLHLNGDIPEPHQWRRCAEFLLRNDYETKKIFKLLRRAKGHELGELALIALEHGQDSAVLLLRRALRSEIPYNRVRAAAVLALFDQPWSRRELINAMEASDDQEMTAECRAALWVSHDAEARECARAWEERNPHEPEVGPFLSMTEMSLRHRHEFLQYEMEKYHDRVMRIRSRGHPLQ